MRKHNRETTNLQRYPAKLQGNSKKTHQGNYKSTGGPCKHARKLMRKHTRGDTNLQGDLAKLQENNDKTNQGHCTSTALPCRTARKYCNAA